MTFARPAAPFAATRTGAGAAGRALARLRRRRSAMLALVVLAALAALVLLAPAIMPYPPGAPATAAMQATPPSLVHPFGTDPARRDVLSRVLHGGRRSLAVAAVATLVAATLGTLVGATAGLAGGRVDALLMRLVDALLALPRILVLIALSVLWEDVPTKALIVLIGATSWFPMSRLVRAHVRMLREREYVLAARALGAGHARVLATHVLPNVAGTVLVAATLVAGDVILVEAGLSFLGLGGQPDDPSWGSLLQEAMSYTHAYWWMAVFPGLAITLTTLAVNHLGDALRDALDVRQLPPG